MNTGGYDGRRYDTNERSLMSMLLLCTIILISHLSYANPEPDFEGYLQFEHLLDGYNPEAQYIGAVTAIEQDSFGFIWIGGESGLIRYDGKNYRSFDTDKGLAGPRVTDILVGSKGRIYVSTTDGLSVFDHQSDHFKNITQQVNAPIRLTLTIYEMENGSFLIGTEQGLYLLSEDHASISEVGSALIGNTPVHDILITNKDQIWIATRGAGIIVLDRHLRDLKSITSVDDGEKHIELKHVERLKQTSRGDIWIATTDIGVFRYTFKDNSYIHLHSRSQREDYRLTGDIIRDLELDDYGNVLIAIDHGGLNVYDPKSNKVYRHKSNVNDSKSLLGDQTQSVFVDKNGDVWTGHFPEGVSFFDRSKKDFRIVRHEEGNPNSISNDGILTLHMHSEDEVWIGTEDGLNRYSLKTGLAKRYMHKPSDPTSLAYKVITDLLRDSQGRLWVASWAGGLNLYHPESDDFTRFVPTVHESSLSSPFVWCLEEDSSGNIWIGTTEFGGINVLDTDTMTFSQKRNVKNDPGSLSNNNVNTIFRDSNGNMWVGTNDGLNMYDPISGRFTQYFSENEDPKSLSGNNIRAIYEDFEGDIWIGTESRGVSLFNRNSQTFSRVLLEGDNSSDTVSSIIQDMHGYLWFGSSNGIVRYDKRTKRHIRITDRDGLSGNLYIRDAVIGDRKDRLFFGSTKGLSIFETTILNNSANEDPLYITDFTALGPDNEKSQFSPSFTDLNIDKKITLSHNINYSDISFALLSYRSSKMTKYSYMLEGFDKSWIDSQYKNNATYTNLDPGEYRFSVRVKKDNDDWQIYDDRLFIKVLPAPWATWWAWTLYFSVSIGVIAFLVQSYIRQLDLEKERSINFNLVKMDKIKDSFLSNTSHELRAPLNGMIAITELLKAEIGTLINRDQMRYMDLVISEGRALAELINDILDYQKMGIGEVQLCCEAVDVCLLIEERVQLLTPLAEHKELALRVSFEHDLPPIIVDRRKAAQILTNLITNAIKYTDRGYVHIGCKIIDSNVAIFVEDTGIGIPPESIEHVFDEFHQVESGGRGSGGTGLGLAITKTLVELMGGTITCTSAVGEGSQFLVTFLSDRRIEKIDEHDTKLITHEKPQESLARKIGNTYSKETLYKVLIVDDDPTQNLILSKVLQNSGFSVEIAATGGKAIELLSNNRRYCIIVSDINMPGMSGLELCKILKSDQYVRGTPFVLVTSQKLNDELHNVTSEVGANAIFEKPINTEVFGSQIIKIIEHPNNAHFYPHRHP